MEFVTKPGCGSKKRCCREVHLTSTSLGGMDGPCHSIWDPLCDDRWTRILEVMKNNLSILCKSRVSWRQFCHRRWRRWLFKRDTKVISIRDGSLAHPLEELSLTNNGYVTISLLIFLTFSRPICGAFYLWVLTLCCRICLIVYVHIEGRLDGIANVKWDSRLCVSSFCPCGARLRYCYWAF